MRLSYIIAPQCYVIMLILLFCPLGTAYGPYPGRGKFGVPSAFQVNFCVLIFRALQPE